MSTPNDGSDLTSDLNQEEIKDRQSPEFHGGLLETQIAKPSIWTREEPFSAIPSMSTAHLSVAGRALEEYGCVQAARPGATNLANVSTAACALT